ncbi:MAG: hypothetical protein H7A32_06150 [Deltaproteobacteria bacterium]|nr:hypothetical protein [Deltaproteobacteria bacterium]
MQEDIQERIIKVEKSNKILKILLFLCLIISLSASGYGLFISYRNYSKLKEDLAKRIITKEIVVRNHMKDGNITLVSNMGNPFISLSAPKSNNQIKINASNTGSNIELLNKDPEYRRILLSNTDEKVEVSLSSGDFYQFFNIYKGSNMYSMSNGLSGVSLMSLTKVPPSLFFYDNNNKTRIDLGIHDFNGTPSLIFFNENERITRRYK